MEATNSKLEELNQKKKDNEIEKRINIEQNSTSKEENFTCVEHWADYSSKYGLGYQLNNGCFGVYFNDSTKIIVDPNGEEFYYFVKDNFNCYHINNYPKDNKDLNKKVILLNYYKKYFEKQYKSKINDIKKSENKPYIYVKKWKRSKQAIYFSLSNRIKQFIFMDKTELIFVYSENSVYYINKKGEKLKYFLKKFSGSSNKELLKRLKYAKDFLIHMSDQNKTKNSTTSQNKEIDEFDLNMKQLKTADSSEILQGEKKIKVEFISVDQTVNYRSVICKSTDKFSKVEDVICKEYHELKKGNYYFIVNGEIADKNKTLEENKIKDKDVITIIEIDKSFFV